MFNIERRSIDYIPLSERRGHVWHLWPVWFAGSAHIATLAVGAIGVALGANLAWAALAVVWGCAFGTFFMAFHSTQGPQLGLPQMIQSRPQFGYMGAQLVWVVALVAFIGYNAFNQILAAQTIQRIMGTHARSDARTITVFGAFAAVLAIAGYDWIHVAQRWIAYAMLAILTILTVGVLLFGTLPEKQLHFGGFPRVAFLTQFFAAASYQLSWSIYVSDYSRYLPRTVSVRASFWWTYIGALVGGTWMMLVGTVAAAQYSTLEVVAAVEALADGILRGSGRWVLLFAFAGLVTISALNAYGASLTFLSIRDSFKRRTPTARDRVLYVVLATVCSTAIAVASSKDFISRFADLLAVLLYLFTPWTAINLVDFYLVRRGLYSVREIFNPHGLYKRWNWRGLLAYAVGFLVMTPFFSTSNYRGSLAGALGGADVAMLVGLPCAAITYLLACRSLDLSEERRRVVQADYRLETEGQRGQ